MGAFGVRQTVFQRMLRREERHDARPRYVAAKIGHEVAQVVFFLRTDGAVGEEHEGVLPRQTPDCVVRIDPRVHALAGCELGARGTQLCREYRRTGTERGQKICIQGSRGSGGELRKLSLYNARR
jgi:hypothetical protein